MHHITKEIASDKKNERADMCNSKCSDRQYLADKEHAHVQRDDAAPSIDCQGNKGPSNSQGIAALSSQSQI